MSRTSSDRSRWAARSSWRPVMRAVRGLPALYVAAFGWAAAAVAGEAVPVGLIARVMLVIGVVIALYATTVAFVLFLACGRFGIVHTPRWRRRSATIAVGSSFVWILVSAWHEGRTSLNLLAIAVVQLAGVALYLGRRSALIAARRLLRFEA